MAKLYFVPKGQEHKHFKKKYKPASIGFKRLYHFAVFMNLIQLSLLAYFQHTDYFISIYNDLQILWSFINLSL